MNINPLRALIVLNYVVFLIPVVMAILTGWWLFVILAVVCGFLAGKLWPAAVVDWNYGRRDRWH